MTNPPGAAGRSSFPMTRSRTPPAPTNVPRFNAGRARSNAFQKPASVVQSGVTPYRAYTSRLSAIIRAFVGAMERPSPVISVVMPWVILLAARLSTSTLYSDWPSMSMNPGATTRFVASMRRFAAAPDRFPTAAIRSPEIPTSARTHGAPVPSTTRPPAKIRSNVAGRGAFAATRARTIPTEPAVTSISLSHKTQGRRPGQSPCG